MHLTNIYLTEGEFTLLGRLEGTVLSKTRSPWPVGDHVFSVDRFGGPLAGLVLAELELALDEDGPSATLTVADVTEDDRFSGGRLTTLRPEEAADLLASVAALRTDVRRQTATQV